MGKIYPELWQTLDTSLIAYSTLVGYLMQQYHYVPKSVQAHDKLRRQSEEDDQLYDNAEQQINRAKSNRTLLYRTTLLIWGFDMASTYIKSWYKLKKYRTSKRKNREISTCR